MQNFLILLEYIALSVILNLKSKIKFKNRKKYVILFKGSFFVASLSI